MMMAKIDNDTRSLVWMGWIFLLIGVGLLLGSAWLFHQEATFEATAQSTSGTVINLLKGVETHRNRDGFSRSSVYYKPVVAFTDGQGQVQEIHSTSGSNPPTYKRGEQVAVLYDPDNPEFAVIDDWRRHLAGMILGGIGLLFTIVGLYIVWTSRQQPTNVTLQTA